MFFAPHEDDLLSRRCPNCGCNFDWVCDCDRFSFLWASYMRSSQLARVRVVVATTKMLGNGRLLLSRREKFVVPAWASFHLCHKYILYLYLYLYSHVGANRGPVLRLVVRAHYMVHIDPLRAILSPGRAGQTDELNATCVCVTHTPLQSRVGLGCFVRHGA